jgi:hypothetical protein
VSAVSTAITGVGTLTSATVSGATTLQGNVGLGNANTDIVTVSGKIAGASPLIFDGATANTNLLTLAVADPASSVTVTIPAETGTLLTTVSAVSTAITGVGQLTVLGVAGDVTVGTGFTITASTGNTEMAGLTLDGAASGSVSQSTSITTGVTKNTHSGTIATQSASTAAGTCSSFQVSNNKVAATSVVLVSMAAYSGSNGNPMVYVKAVASGTFDVNICNLATGSGTTAHTSANAGVSTTGTSAEGGQALAGTITFNFAVINHA